MMKDKAYQNHFPFPGTMDYDGPPDAPDYDDLEDLLEELEEDRRLVIDDAGNMLSADTCMHLSPV